MAKDRTPNDQRSDSKNPTSAENKAANDNRSVQLNENKSQSASKGT